MKAMLSALVMALMGLTFAQTYTLIINGQEVSVPAIVMEGQTYLPLEALEQAGMLVSRSADSVSVQFGPAITGGANEIKALEGCMNQFLLNGIWRFQVTSFESFSDGSLSGWNVAIELRNATERTLSPHDFGVEGDYRGVVLALDNGSVLSMHGSYIARIQNDLVFKELPPAAGTQVVLQFRSDGSDAQPKHLLFPMNPARRSFRAEGLDFATDAPSFRIRLNCN